MKSITNKSKLSNDNIFPCIVIKDNDIFLAKKFDCHYVALVLISESCGSYMTGDVKQITHKSFEDNYKLFDGSITLQN